MGEDKNEEKGLSREEIKKLPESERKAYMSSLGRKKLGYRKDAEEKEGKAKLNTIYEEMIAKIKAIQVDKGPTELDDKIIWLSRATDILQKYGLYRDVRQMDGTLAKLVDSKTRLQLLLENKITTDMVWEQLKEIIEETISDTALKDNLLEKLASRFDTLLQNAASK